MRASRPQRTRSHAEAPSGPVPPGTNCAMQNARGAVSGRHGAARRAVGVAAHQRHVISVEEDLVQPRHALSLGRDLTARGRRQAWGIVRLAKADEKKKRCCHALLGDVLEHHVHIVVEAAQRSDQLLVAAHNHPHAAANTFIDELCGVHAHSHSG